MQTLVVCNGAAPPGELLEQLMTNCDFCIAADGGANHILEAGLTPGAVIGDMDSFDPPEQAKYPIIHDADQYTNDLEKALHYALERHATQVTVLAATGCRLDHTLKNLSVMKQFNDQFAQLQFLDDYGRWTLVPSGYSEVLPKGTVVSLFPLSGTVTGVTTTGLQYPLTDGTLQNGVQDGSSNTVTAQPVIISYTAGDLLLFVGHH